MIKLGKANLLAIIECGLFLIGAVFFLVMLIDPANPLWALVIGMLFAGAGVIVWVGPLAMRMAHGVAPQKQAIIDAATDAEDTYELHRPAPQMMPQIETIDTTASTPVADQPETPTPVTPTEVDLDF